MLKKGAALLVLIIFTVLVTGCETAKGLAKDTENTWRTLKKADKWLQKNAW